MIYLNKTSPFMPKMLVVILLGLCSIAILGCGNYMVAKREAIDKQIEAARVETSAKIEALNVNKEKVLRETIATHEAREQSAADQLFKGVVVFGGLKPELIDRSTLVMGHSIQKTALLLPPATPAAQSEAIIALKTEMDETKTSTAALVAKYEAELGKARQEGVAVAKALEDKKAELAAIEVAKTKAVEDAATKERQLQKEKDKVQDEQLAAKTKEAENAKSIQEVKLKLSATVGGLALLCLAGAIWSPVFKDKFGMAAAALGLIAVAIWYIQGWMVALAGGVSLLGLVGWAAKNHYIESKTATSVYRAVQSFKDQASDEYEKHLKPHLTEWMTTYDKHTGEKTPDKTSVNHIDKRLMEVGDK